MKIPFLPILIISEKRFKNEWEMSNRIMAKLLEDNRVLTAANREYYQRLKRKKLLG